VSDRIPKYRKHSSRDVAFVEHEGKRIYLGKYNSADSRKKYKTLIEEWYGRHVAIDKVVTVADLAVAFLDWAQVSYPGGKQGTYSYLRAAVKYMTSLHGGMRVSDVRPIHVVQARAAAVKNGACRTYANAVARHIRRMFKWGVAEGHVSADVAYGLSCIEPLKAGRGDARESVKRRPVSWCHVRHTIKHLKREPLKDMVRMQWLTGARSGNVCRMRWSDLHETKDGTVWMPSSHKNSWRGQQLTIMLGPKAEKILARYDRSKEFVFYSRHKKPYKQKSYRMAIASAVKDALMAGAPVAHWSPHQIRHSRATRIRSVYGIEAAQLYLGLASIDVAQIYAHESLKKVSAIAKRIG